MVSPAMGAVMMGTMYSLQENGAQHGGGASGGGWISASLLCYGALDSTFDLFILETNRKCEFNCFTPLL